MAESTTDATSAATSTSDPEAVDRARRLEEIEEVMREVFDVQDWRKWERLDRMKEYLADAPVEAWHFDPFETAADLAEKEPTQERMRRYIELRRRWSDKGDFPDEATLAKAFAEQPPAPGRRYRPV